MYFPLKISIPAPCHEDWNKMTPVELNQRHCTACDRVLTDFSTMTDAQIGSHLRRHQGRLCGRFRAGQLDRALAVGGPQRFSGLRAAAAAAGLLFTLPATGQEHKPAVKEQLENAALRPGHVTQHPASNEPNQKALGSVLVTGTITDKVNGDPLIGASVLIKSTTNGTATDLDGRFELTVPTDRATTLVTSYTGYETTEVEISARELRNAFRTGSLTRNPTMEPGELGQEGVWLAGVIVRHRSLPHRIFVAPVERYVVWPTRRLINSIREWRAERRTTRPERKAARQDRRLKRQRESQADEVPTTAPKTSLAPAAAPGKTLNLTVSPNPFTEYINLSFNLDSQQRYTLEILTAEGKIIVTQSGAGNAGTQKLQLRQKLVALPAGTYFLRVVTERGVVAAETLVK